MDRIFVGGRGLFWRRNVVYRIIAATVPLCGLTVVSCIWTRRGGAVPSTRSAWQTCAAMEPLGTFCQGMSRGLGVGADADAGAVVAPSTSIGTCMTNVGAFVSRSPMMLRVAGAPGRDSRQPAIEPILQRHVPCLFRAERTLDLLPDPAWPLILLLTCNCSHHQALAALHPRPEQRATLQKTVHATDLLF